MTAHQTLELPISGMECAECASHVQKALANVPGVESAQVLLSSEKAIVRLDPSMANTAALHRAVESAGYRVPQHAINGVQTIEVPVRGMDCAECASHVQKALAGIPGVASANVLLSAEKAVLTVDPVQVSMAAIHTAIAGAGYSVPEDAMLDSAAPAVQSETPNFTRRVLTLFGIVFALVLFVVVVGEGMGLFESLTERVPLWIGALVVLAAGWPIFRNVVRATLRGQVISHTLMSLGALAALFVGQWATAVVVVFFMRVGEYAEQFTTEQARKAVKNLTALAPQMACVERDGTELEVPIAQVRIDETVVVRPGEKIPVDGEVITGQATINQAAITGESIPVEASAGAKVYAATIATGGSLRLRVTAIGADTTFGKVIRMVEEAEMHRADVQRIADKFSAWYLPVVATIAALTFIISRNPLATAAVMVVACSCSFALATPIAMLASVGAAAKRGLLFKGGKYIETLAKADTVLVDKTGTLTLGRPQLTDVVAVGGTSQSDLLALAASVERDSEHPLAAAVRAAATERSMPSYAIERFESIVGQGVRAQVHGRSIAIGNRRLIGAAAENEQAETLETQGKTVLFVAQNDMLIGMLAVADTVRPEIADAFRQLRARGVSRIEMLTGDNERVAAALAAQFGIGYRANLLPEDKIAIVREHQQQGRTVVMVGDGINDAPALAQADIGIAMGAAGTDIALEAAHVALMRDDWMLVPEAIGIAKRTMRVVKTNIGFTAAYNLVGLSLAAFGILPPIWAAAAQSLPDLGILANSARLLRQK